MPKTMPKLDNPLLTQIAKLLRPTFSNTKNLSEKSVVLVIGSSGAGVSTVFSYLNGNHFNKEAGPPVPTAFPYSEIRDGLTTKTVNVIASCKDAADDQRHIFLDIPGFMPVYQQNGVLNREADQYEAREIAGSLAQLIAARSSKNAQIIFVIDVENIINPRDGGIAFKNGLQHFITYLPSFESNKNSILFVFNQGKSAKKNIDEITCWLNKFKDEHEKHADIIRLVDIIFAALNNSSAVMLNLLNNEDRRMILDALASMPAIPTNNFQLVAPPGMLLSLKNEIHLQLSNATSVLCNIKQAVAKIALFKEISNSIISELNEANIAGEVTALAPLNLDINLLINVLGLFNDLDMEFDRAKAASHLGYFKTSKKHVENYQNEIKEKKEKIQQLNEEIKKLSKENLTVLTSWTVNEPVNRDHSPLPLWVPLFPDRYYSMRHWCERKPPLIRFTKVSYEELSPAGKANGTFEEEFCKPDTGELKWWYIPSKEATEVNYRVTVYCTTYSYNETTIKQKKAEKATLEAEVTDLIAKKADCEKSMANDKQIIQQFLTDVIQLSELKAEPCRREFEKLKNKFADPIQADLFAFYLQLNCIPEFQSESETKFLNAFAQHAKFGNVSAGVEELRETAIKALSLELPDNNIDVVVTPKTYPALANIRFFTQGTGAPVSLSAAPQPVAAQTSLSS